MLRNYLLITIRNLLKRKVYSLINIMGLAVGLAAVTLIFLYVRHEVSYDSFHKDSERIYRIAWMSDQPQTRVPHPMAESMVRDFPEVDAAVSITPIWGPGLTKRTFSIKNPEAGTWYDEEAILAVDSTFFNVFSFELVEGNKQTVLRNAGGMLISESMAIKYFGNEPAVGKQIAFDNDEQLLVIEGVFKDVAENSHFHFDFLLSYVSLKVFAGPETDFFTWEDFGHFNYLKLKEGADAVALQNKIIPWIVSYVDWDENTVNRLINSNFFFKLQPLKSIHLQSDIRWELEENGNMDYIYIMSAAALFILLIACFNFMNLSTAKSLERANEVGVRKSLGALKSQLVKQFLGETIMLTIVAIIIAGLLVEVLLPTFNIMMGKSLEFQIANPLAIGSFLLISIMIGVLAGLYPATILASLDPVTITKGKFSSSGKGQTVRKTLLTLQFAISMFLIAGSLTVISQLNYLKDKDLGFDKTSLITIPITTSLIEDKYDVIQTELLKLDGVLEVGAASNIPGKQFNNNPAFLKSEPSNRINMSQCFVDYDFISTLGLEIVKGRQFNRSQIADIRSAFIINEMAVTAFGLEEPIGKVIILEEDGRDIEGVIIGVVSDFNYASLHSVINPLLIQLRPGYNQIIARVDAKDLDINIASISKLITQFDEKVIFEYSFLDDSLNALYDNEARMASVFTSFSVLAIIIACLGLGGLASINFSFKKKEIGIRKVLGASSKIIIINLLKEYSIIVIIAIIISFPFYGILMSNWLDNFNYHVSFNPSIFLISSIGLLLLSWIILSVLTLGVVRENPVDSLKEE